MHFNQYCQITLFYSFPFQLFFFDDFPVSHKDFEINEK